MARVISVTLPLWPLHRLRRQAPEAAPSPDALLVLAGRVGRRRLITATDEVVLSFVLHVSMPVSKALALVPELQVLLADPAVDAALLERLALWVLQRVSSIVAVDAPDRLVINSIGARTSLSALAALHRHHVPIALPCARI